MSMVTKATWVAGEISIWAIPRDPKYIKPGEEPFTYELKDNRSYHWKTGAVCVFSTELSVELPAGINLFLKAVETLDKAVEEENAQHNERIADLTRQREQLLLLAAPTKDETIVGEQ